MVHDIKKEGKYSYLEVGEGTPMIILHGLMGGLSNFNGVTSYFSTRGYKVIVPELPIYKSHFYAPMLRASLNTSNNS